MVDRNKKRQLQAMRRCQRLELIRQQVLAASKYMDGLRSRKPLLIRTEFVYRSVLSVTDHSDRKVPPPDERPPATRLISPRGSALRLELIALGVAQRHRVGSEFKNELPLVSSYDPDGSPAWTDLITTPAKYSSTARVYVTALDKRRRSLNTALDALANSGLVEYPHSGNAQGKRERFLLMDERALSKTAGLIYKVPRANERTVSVPPGFLHNGWVHVLEDSEIAVLLMVLCGIGSLPESDGWVAIPAAERLLSYGVSRDNFSTAHPVLREMGLLEVESVNRHEDGHVKEFETEGPSLHRLRVLEEGFDRDAYEVAHSVLKRLSR